MKKRAISKKAENILRRVIAAILEEPNRFNMETWGSFFEPEDNQTRTSVRLIDENGYTSRFEQKIPPCRTVACVAGHCLLQSRVGVKLLKENNGWHPLDNGLVNINFDTINAEESAQQILGITPEQAQNLFYLPTMVFAPGNGWPEQFSLRYNKAKSAKKRARIAADRIEHFIITGE